MQDINDEQRERIERLARDKGMACQTCGSSELRSDDTASPLLGNSFFVNLWCTNAAGHPARDPSAGARQTFNLSPDEARSVGIRTIPGGR